MAEDLRRDQARMAARFTHLNDGVRVSGEHLPFEGQNLLVVFAPNAIQHHSVLRLHHQVLASVGHRRPVGFVWKQVALLAYNTYPHTAKVYNNWRILVKLKNAEYCGEGLFFFLRK